MKISELLTSKDKWTQGPEAEDRYGRPVYHDSPRAVCWCLMGALMKCYPDVVQRDAARMRLYEAIRFPNIMWWNECPERTFVEVKAAVEAAGV